MKRGAKLDCLSPNHQVSTLSLQHSVTFRLIEDYFRREEMVLNTVIEAGSMEATKELVKLGLGVSILAPWIAKKEIEEGSMVALPLGRKNCRGAGGSFTGAASG